MTATTLPPPRRVSIDWLRGFAVLTMIEWHVVDAWAVATNRDTDLWANLAWIGGWAAPLFLMLAGVSVGLAGETRMAKGLSRRESSWTIQIRGAQVFGIAILMRLVSMAEGGRITVWGLLRPDILNILGLGIIAAGWAWGRARSIASAAAWLLVPAALIVIFTPDSRVWWWPTLLHPRLEAYIRPVPGQGVFQLFPEAAYIFAGAFLGLVISRSRVREREWRFQLAFGGAGLAILLAGWWGSYRPPLFARSDFWTTSISIVVMRLAAMMIAMSLAWLWLKRPTSSHWSPLVLFGRTSLFVYWVHLELAYGILSSRLHHALSVGWSLVGVLAMTGLMIGAAALWQRRPRRLGVVRMPGTGPRALGQSSAPPNP